MGVILDLLTGIPLNAVYRERIIDFERKMAALELENKELKTKITILEAEITVLETENGNFKSQINQIKSSQKVLYDICPYCQRPEGKVVDIKPHPFLGEAGGIKIFYYECNNCHKKYDREKENF